MSAPSLPTAKILSYWFGDLGDDTEISMQMPQVRRWHAKDAVIDDEIRARFEMVYEAQKPFWLVRARNPATPFDRLALVILFDQFPRNMHRDTPAMYETDPIAVRLCLEGVKVGEGEPLSLIQRMFLYMPLMHAEDMALQDRTVLLFEGLVTAAPDKSPANVGFFRMALGFATKHRDIVARFGRYPHRNVILGRDSTDEERQFLAQEGSSF